MSKNASKYIPFLDLETVNGPLKAHFLKATDDFIDSKTLVLGTKTIQFEKAYAQFIGTKYCIGVSNGLDALELCLKAINIKPNDEVIVASNAYIACILAIINVGAVPVFVEPNKKTANIDVNKIEHCITPKTKGIMVVHLYGQICEMQEISKIAEKYQLEIIEDVAQAHGASYKGKKAGSFGRCNAVSFYPTKNLGALGEAGAVTTNDKAIAERIKVMRNYGLKSRYFNTEIGKNARIDELQAAFLLIKLPYLNAWNEQRCILANAYFEALKDNKVVQCLEETKIPKRHVYHLFVVKCLVDRAQLQAFLEDRGIGTLVHYPVPPHLQRALDFLAIKKGRFPIAEKMAKTVLSLPLYPGLTIDKVNYIAATIRSFKG